MLLRTTDPFRDFDRLAQQLLGTTNRPVVMPMDAWREGDRFVIEFDLPGVSPESVDLDVERNVLTVSAERVSRNGDWEMLASERPRGRFSRQLVLGDNLDLDRIEAGYEDGVLRLVVPGRREGEAAQDPDHRRPDQPRLHRGLTCRLGCRAWPVPRHRPAAVGPLVRRHRRTFEATGMQSRGRGTAQVRPGARGRCLSPTRL